MRRRYKLLYTVQDWQNITRQPFWWCRGKWVRDPEPPASSCFRCRSWRSAERNARRLAAAGGVPLIVQFSTKGGKRRLREYTIREE